MNLIYFSTKFKLNATIELNYSKELISSNLL